MKKYTVLFLLLFTTHFLNAQFNWTNKKMFEKKNFIENKGQADDKKIPSKEHVLYTAAIDGVEYLFTTTGYTIVRYEQVKRTRKEVKKILAVIHHNRKKSGKQEEEESKEEREEEKEELERKLKYKTIEKYHELKFADANPSCSVTADNAVSHYYSYSAPKNKKGKTTFIAHAFKRLIYKNIYPNTDIVFEFPKDSSGIKYSIYLHPGADVSKIKMIFPGEKYSLNKNNELVIAGGFGEVMDHAPVSFLQNTNTFVKSNFILSDNSIGFSLEKTDKNSTVVIDPWTVTPSFSLSDEAFDVDYDNSGNVYVYGEGSFLSAELLKYSPTGTLIWNYTTSGFYYGDFAVDRNNNTIFMVEGFNAIGTGAQIEKIDAAATLLNSFGGDPNFIEMWRVAFDPCDRQAVIAGGGISSSSYQTCMLDTTLGTIAPVSFVPLLLPHHDVGSLA
ncbi:MAG: hypothetical protein H0X46_06795, partial [Bacteroidetes bacterium]|nr:hypothetical protein [Bacteroidota bacterium]